MAEENIRFYIEKFTPPFIGLLTPTTPSECLSAFDFQKKWHSWRSHVLKRLFPTGIWVRERQPRTGNWHAHAVVNVGWDIQTGFPWEQVSHRVYSGVDPRLRKLWKQLRDTALVYGFGRVELLPIKTGGPACARYLTKYLLKVRGSDKLEGEEKCRLFGVWGGVRYMNARFSFVRSRIWRKRKEWLADHFGISEEKGFARVFGQHWWFHLGDALSEVILPVEYYQVRDENGALSWDDIGFSTYAEDIARFGGAEINVESAASHSQYSLFHEVGKLLFGKRTAQASEFAYNQMARRLIVEKPLDPQLILKLGKKNGVVELQVGWEQ